MLRDLALYVATAAVAVGLGLWLGSDPLPAQWEPPAGSEVARDAGLAGVTVEFDTGF